jgi:hypothetical protein
MNFKLEKTMFRFVKIFTEYFFFFALIELLVIIIEQKSTWSYIMLSVSGVHILCNC